MAGYEKGGLKIIDIGIKRKAVLVGRVFKFLNNTGEVPSMVRARALLRLPEFRRK